MDFDINALIVETLKPLDIPVVFVAGKETRFPFVVFNITGEKGKDYWEDEETSTDYYITFNIFSKGNFTKIKNDMKKLLKEAGFLKQDIPACIYLEDVEVYNQPMEYTYNYLDLSTICPNRANNLCGKCEEKENN